MQVYGGVSIFNMWLPRSPWTLTCSCQMGKCEGLLCSFLRPGHGSLTSSHSSLAGPGHMSIPNIKGGSHEVWSSREHGGRNFMNTLPDFAVLVFTCK